MQCVVLERERESKQVDHSLYFIELVYATNECNKSSHGVARCSESLALVPFLLEKNLSSLLLLGVSHC